MNQSNKGNNNISILLSFATKQNQIVSHVLAITAHLFVLSMFTNFGTKFKKKKSQHIICTDQRVGVQKLSEDISHEHSHVSRSRFQQLNVLELAVHLVK